jgi:hypothetical protein
MAEFTPTDGLGFYRGERHRVSICFNTYLNT